MLKGAFQYLLFPVSPLRPRFQENTPGAFFFYYQSRFLRVPLPSQPSIVFFSFPSHIPSLVSYENIIDSFPFPTFVNGNF